MTRLILARLFAAIKSGGSNDFFIGEKTKTQFLSLILRPRPRCHGAGGGPGGEGADGAGWEGGRENPSTRLEQPHRPSVGRPAGGAWRTTPFDSLNFAKEPAYGTKYFVY
jgi:hypothetical protein